MRTAGRLTGIIFAATAYWLVMSAFARYLVSAYGEPDLGNTPEPFVYFSCFWPVGFLVAIALGAKLGAKFGSTGHLSTKSAQTERDPL
jgi:hypothetical protein